MIRVAPFRYNVAAMTEKITLPPEAVEALRGGNKIEAIKLMRQKTGIGLAEAKAVVEAFEGLAGGAGHANVSIRRTMSVKRNEAARPSGLSPGEEPRGGGSWRAAIAIGILLVIAIFWAKLG